MKIARPRQSGNPEMKAWKDKPPLTDRGETSSEEENKQSQVFTVYAMYGGVAVLLVKTINAKLTRVRRREPC